MKLKKPYIDKNGDSYGKCQVCGFDANGKFGKFIKEFTPISMFRGDDEMTGCWCKECWNKSKKVA